ncbi:hypothetical protein J4H92_04450 [Leucobacter weissii]|uniref:PucR C-terminal helix-turn-helix domain-containing protein n=1 Tax=Leucobacter weissii TaxID=1983706 RepID=A0A939MHU8_9MICO|nr:hypothetical protein [Leucobacter weissii]MBO1901199.1 hypothetical protein [Leucobacter weissii]
MQELLGRLGALDPEASQSLRVVACFDELMAGGVGVRGLMSAAAALAGRPVGLVRSPGHAAEVVGPDGIALAPVPPGSNRHRADPLTVWIVDEDLPTVNDRIILERLALALQLRLNGGTRPERRDLASLIDPETPRSERLEIAVRRGLDAGLPHRAVATPLFATWRRRPTGLEDVVPTEHGPVQLSIVDARAEAAADPIGISRPADLVGLPAAARSALVCLRLCTAREPAVRADELGGLAEVLADAPADRPPDQDELALAALAEQTPWVGETVEALTRASTAREAARLASVHHSTMNARLDTMTGALGYHPLDGLGRARFALSALRWRLRRSEAFVLPPPPAGR